MPLNPAELERLLVDLESDRVERKESFAGSAPKKVREAVCAFANDLPDHRQPGVVFIGARDDGIPAGLTVSDKLLLDLADIKTDGNILPPPSLTVEKRILRGAELAVVTVQPSDSPPVRYQGKICIRIGARQGLASAQDERVLNEKRRYRDLPFDINPVPSATVRDLDRRFFDDVYLPQAVDPEVLAANQRTLEQRLAASKLVSTADEPTPTVLGLLVAGIRPQDFLPGAYAQFLRIDGTELTDEVIDDQELGGSVSDVLRALEDKLKSHNRVRVEFQSVAHERRLAAYPLSALQQLVRNAVMHRTYEATNAPVRVYWFNDRIEIYSPGGPFGTVTRENFGQPGVTDYRNPNLAAALKVLGYVQKYGMGIAIARAELAKNGHPEPVFEVTPSAVMWRIGAAR